MEILSMTPDKRKLQQDARVCLLILLLKLNVNFSAYGHTLM